MVRWQYRVVDTGTFFAAGNLADSLGKLGEDGWELVTVYDKGSTWIANMERGFALFKRPVPDGEEPVGAWASVVATGPAAAPAPASRLDTLLHERGIHAPGASEALSTFVGNGNVDALCATGTEGADGVFVVTGDRAAAWSRATGAVETLELRSLQSVTASGRLITLRTGSGTEHTLIVADEKTVKRWLDLFARFGAVNVSSGAGKIDALLRQRGIEATGASEPLSEFAGKDNVDALCMARANERDGIFVIAGGRVGVWDAATATVHPFDMRAFPTVSASGRLLTLHSNEGFDVILTVGNEAAVPRWIELLGKFGVQPR